MSADDTVKLDDLSPQVLRLLELAAIEARRNLNQRGDRICPEHLLVAILQDADAGSLAFETVSGLGLTIADIRAGQVKPKGAGDLPAKI